MRNVSDTIFAEKTTTQISSSMNFFPENRAVYEIMHCCFSTATTVTRTRGNVTLHIYVLSRITLPFTSRSSKWSPSIGFSQQKSVYSSVRCHKPRYLPQPLSWIPAGCVLPFVQETKFYSHPEQENPYVCFHHYVTSTLRVLYSSNPGSRWGLPH